MPTLPSNLNIIASTGLRGRRVPNVVPTSVFVPYRLALVGEAPGAEEDRDGIPFSGPSGRFLSALLSASGIQRSQCLVANVCQYRPPNNDLGLWGWECDEVQAGLDTLSEDITKFQPNLIVALGKYAQRALCGTTRSVFDWRGSLFRGTLDGPARGRKCMATLHPAYVLRDYSASPLLRFDLGRARKQAETASLDLPQRSFVVSMDANTIVRALDDIPRDASVHMSFDLEGYWNRLTRYSVSTSPTSGFIVPFTAGDYGSAWSPSEECAIWQATSRVCSDPRIPKVLQNSLYDRFVLAYKHKILLRNVKHDTMLGHWEMYAELPKSLGLQASIYTLEPYWKEDREDDSLQVRMEYCCKDSAVTEEIRLTQIEDLASDPGSQKHFAFNMQLLNPMLYMELRGLRYDKKKANDTRCTLTRESFEKQHDLNLRAKQAFTGDVGQLLCLAKERLCKKREAQFVSTFAQLPAAALKAESEEACRLATIMGTDVSAGVALDNARLGEIESLLGIGLNVDSNKQMVEYLYGRCGYERQFNRDKKKDIDILTADAGACLTLFRKYKDQTMTLILEIRSALDQAQTLGIKTDDDGRIRCGYNICGTGTGDRLSCRESPTGSGYNLQTVRKKFRNLILADEGMDFFQCDLAGADGWTVAAHCNRLGDPTMLLDYKAGIKPARVVALAYLHGEAALSWPRERILAEGASIKEDKGPVPWLYFACKRVQHATNYGTGVATMSKQMLEDSYKKSGTPVFVDPAICRQLQSLYLRRYPGVPLWQRWVEQQLIAHQSLRSAHGGLHRFFGRLKDREGRMDHQTLLAALSHEPQSNTTYATNLAALNLWSDPDNRRPDGTLIIEPLHQVHDALNGQWPSSSRTWAVGKLRSYFDNVLVIADQPIVIPFEGAYGRSWGELDAGVI